MKNQTTEKKTWETPLLLTLHSNSTEGGLIGGVTEGGHYPGSASNTTTSPAGTIS